MRGEKQSSGPASLNGGKLAGWEAEGSVDTSPDLLGRRITAPRGAGVMEPGGRGVVGEGMSRRRDRQGVI